MLLRVSGSLGAFVSFYLSPCAALRLYPLLLRLLLSIVSVVLPCRPVPVVAVFGGSGSGAGGGLGERNTGLVGGGGHKREWSRCRMQEPAH